MSGTVAESETVRIGNGQAFWGDWREAPGRLVRSGTIDYLTLDYLAEVTMSLLHKQRANRPELGYPPDFVDLMTDILGECVSRGVRVVTNAGGLNPQGCAAAVVEVARRLGLDGVRVAGVVGDDLMPVLPTLLASGHALTNLDTGEAIDVVRDRLVAVNAYIGAFPIAEALARGADVVIAGRCTDPSLVVGPLIHEFGWGPESYDQLARASVAGHLAECGPQVTGGNFEGGWWDVPDMADIGYPVVEVAADGTFVVTKPPGTGGLVDRHTVAEQLLYELGDPGRYLTPDVTVDLGQVELTEVGPHRVRVTGVVGGPPTGSLKVSGAYRDGYMNSSSLVYSWPHAHAKAEKAAAVLRRRFEQLDLTFDDINFELVGHDSMLGPLTEGSPHEPAEVMLRVAARGTDRADLDRFGREFAPVALAGPAGAAGFATGRPRASEIVGYWPALIDKAAVQVVVNVQGGR